MKKVKQVFSIRKDTQTYTLNDIWGEVKEDVEILKSLGYSDLSAKRYIPKLAHKLTALGTCHQVYDTNRYEISVNETYLKVAKPEDLHNTIMHECIHSVDGCMDHGEKWKSVGKKVNQFYVFTPFSRTTNSPEYRKAVEKKYLYSATCVNCHKTWKWARRGKVFVCCVDGTATCPCGCKHFICKVGNNIINKGE